MKRLIAYALGFLCLTAAGCGDTTSTPSEEPPRLPELSDKPVTPRLPYLDFYSTEAKAAILEFETDAGSVFDPATTDAATLAFESANENFPRTEYKVLASRLLTSVALYGAGEEDVWNENLLDFLTSSGFAAEEYSDLTIRLLDAEKGIRAEIMRITSDRRSLIRFTPSREQPSLPAPETKLIHPFHTIGASVEQIYAAELAEGRQLQVSEEGRLYVSFPEDGTLFERFGFFIDEGSLYKVMSILVDGSYLNTQEFVDEMAAEGFIYERQDGYFRYFRAQDGSVVVRSADAAPYPTIEYLDPDSVEAQ